MFLKSDERTLNIINCNSYDIETIHEHIEGKIEWNLSDTQHVSLYNIYKYKFTQSTQSTQYKNLLDKIFLSNNFVNNFEGMRDTSNSLLDKIINIPDINYLLEYLQDVKLTALDFTKASVAKTNQKKVISIGSMDENGVHTIEAELTADEFLEYADSLVAE